MPDAMHSIKTNGRFSILLNKQKHLPTYFSNITVPFPFKTIEFLEGNILIFLVIHSKGPSPMIFRVQLGIFNRSKLL